MVRTLGAAIVGISAWNWFSPSLRTTESATLDRVAALRPAPEEKLLEIKGIGPAIVRRHGAAILEIVARLSPPAGGV